MRAAIELLDGGATVPFVARYRKEATGGLDDAQLRTLDERLAYLRELEERRAAVLDSVREQGKLTDELHAQHPRRGDQEPPRGRLPALQAEAPHEGDDRARGGPRAARRRACSVTPRSSRGRPATRSSTPTRGVPDADAALDGARAILVERLAEDADLVGELRERMWARGRVVATVRDGKAEDTAASKFSDYFAFDEPFTQLPSHRILALLRGEAEEVLALTFDPCSADDDGDTSIYEARVAAAAGIADRGRAGRLAGSSGSARWAWRTRISSRLVVDLRVRLREVAEEGAVGVFAGNLRDLLLAAPAGARPTLGLDPGLRTGREGRGRRRHRQGRRHRHDLPARPAQPVGPARWRRWPRSSGDHGVAAGGHRQRHRVAGDPQAGPGARRGSVPGLIPAMVSEAGASVYSASEEASKELPDLDVSLRGAVSIARRLQDPLAELVKIDPKSIGVGQYQHDVSATMLSRSLDGVVEDCVNAVGVDVNTASAPLLRRVSGISTGLATTIVGFRDEHGPFRVADGADEGAAARGEGVRAVRGLPAHPRRGRPARPLRRCTPRPTPWCGASSESTGVRRGLVGRQLRAARPARPRRVHRRDASASRRSPTSSPSSTSPAATRARRSRPRPSPRASSRSPTSPSGMVLEGVVTNVAAFGAFVDVGVHQDGLVHISAMSKEFVSDPRTVVGPGDVVRVKVLDVDVPRKRISLTLRLDDEPGAGGGEAVRRRSGPVGGRGRPVGGRGKGGPRERRTARDGQAGKRPQPVGRPGVAGWRTQAQGGRRPRAARRRPAAQPGGRGRQAGPGAASPARAAEGRDAVAQQGRKPPRGGQGGEPRRGGQDGRPSAAVRDGGQPGGKDRDRRPRAQRRHGGRAAAGRVRPLSLRPGSRGTSSVRPSGHGGPRPPRRRTRGAPVGRHRR